MQENTQDMISQEEIDALLSPMTAEEWMDWMKKRHGENKQPLPENLNGTLSQEDISAILSGKVTVAEILGISEAEVERNMVKSPPLHHDENA